MYVQTKSFRARSAELAYWLSRRWLSSWQLTGEAFNDLGTVLWSKPAKPFLILRIRTFEVEASGHGHCLASRLGMHHQ